MNSIIRIPDDILIRTKNAVITGNDSDIKVRFDFLGGCMNAFISAEKSEPTIVRLRWNFQTKEPVRVLGDKWERAYGNLSWTGIDPEKFMPWYFMLNNEKSTIGYGVKVQPNSFVSFEYDAGGISAFLDVRSGGKGVRLNGRELLAATFVCKSYTGISPFEATKDFCRVMSPNPILPKEPVYGSNNWYYAYGNSSREELLNDARFMASVSKNNENRPYMVIDDGWSLNTCSGPWLPNEKYGDMGEIAEEFKKIGVKPGIWIRLLHDDKLEEEHPEWRIKRDDELGCLDPTNPNVQNYLRETLRRIKGWGYELLKHDYSTYDIFGEWGCYLNGSIIKDERCRFFDDTKTNAEIVLDFYKLIRAETGNMVIIGCNTVSHLCAGLVEVNRIGDDTSGASWSRTRALGINSLAFRLPQNRSFYMVDADCVGILGNHIPWEKNKLFLELLAKSGTPLFISCDPKSATSEIKADLEKAFKIAQKQENTAEPIDWLYNKNPAYWRIDGTDTYYDWFYGSYPAFLKNDLPSIGLFGEKY